MTERTWRQGYVPGKAKKTIHIDDEVARVLEIRAAQERVSQSEIIERALRKELGMMVLTRQYISDATGFDHGDEFTSEEQVREYFTVDNMRAMFGECAYTQDELDEMADAVIHNGWHMARECDICSHAGIYTAATQEIDGKHLCDVCAKEMRG